MNSIIRIVPITNNKNSLINNNDEKINSAIDIALKYGQIDSAHHKMWVIDKMLKILSGNKYDQLISEFCNDNDDESKDVASQKSKMQKLFQILDGVDSCPNSIIIATTNHISKLDENMIRDGRFDLKIEIEEFGEAESIEMCKMFSLSALNTDRLLNSITYPIKPVILQNKITEIL